MKRVKGTLLMIVCLFSICSCKPGSITDSQSQYSGSNAPLLLDAQLWESDPSTSYVFDDFFVWDLREDINPFNPLDFTAIEPITVTGQYPLPPVTNATPLIDMVSTIGGGPVLYAVEHGTFSFGGSSMSTKLRQFWGENATHGFIPVNFLRQVEEGVFYTVCKVENGGFAYFFFDRPVRQNGVKWEHTTNDPTDLFLTGAVYGETLSAYEKFAQIEVGASINDLIAIDHSFQFFKDMYQARYVLQEENYIAQHGTVHYSNSSGVFSANILLSDGILEVIFGHNDPDFDQKWYIDENGIEHYEYDINNLYVKNISYYSDYIVSPKSLANPYAKIGITYNRYILPIDRMTR